MKKRKVPESVGALMCSWKTQTLLAFYALHQTYLLLECVFKQ